MIHWSFSGRAEWTAPPLADGGGLMMSRRALWRRPWIPGATVRGVAGRYGLRANRISEWRRLAKDGKLILPAAAAPSGFTSLMLCDEEPSARSSAGTGGAPLIEIAVGTVMIRLDAGTPTARIAEIVRAVGSPA